MSVLVFDTETTGLPNWKQPSSDPNQPHLVQLALVTYDDAGVEASAQSIIIKPDGWVIPDEVAAIHGITQAIALKQGIPEVDAVVMYIHEQAKAATRVAHNIGFDDRIMRIAMLRVGIAREQIEAIEARPKFCTSNAAKPIVNLPPTSRMVNAGFGGAKQPKLVECMEHFFGDGLDGAHDALVDARACGRLYFHLKSLEREAV